MPKSKKKKNNDFQKIKLKVGKKLPSGTNVTNLSFKTRQIQLTQRIKGDDIQEPITKQKLTIQDLLRRCDHHSSSARVDAISGLKELWFNSSGELLNLSNHFGYFDILKKMSMMFIDDEAVVRHSAINLFKLVCNKLSSKDSGKTGRLIGDNLYKYIHAYLCCAMSHAHEDIRLDALILFDILLDNFPVLMVQQTGDLLKNLVGLVSSPMSVGSAGNLTTQRLSLNPDSKLPAMKFRAKVLHRVKRILQEAVNNDVTDPTLFSCSGDKIWSLQEAQTNKRRQNTMIRTKRQENLFQILFSGGCIELEDYITNPASLKSFLSLSVPVLIQCWKEARASVDDFSSSVSFDSLEVMSLVISVIQLLFSLCLWSDNTNSYCKNKTRVSVQHLIGEFCAEFEQQFMSQFPYSFQIQSGTNKKKNKNRKAPSPADNSAACQTSLKNLNLGLCDIMTRFLTDPSFGQYGAWLSKVEKQVIKTVNTSTSLEQCRTVMALLKNVFENPSALDNFTTAYKAVFRVYISSGKKLDHKKMWYTLFALMARKWDGWDPEDSTCNTTSFYSKNSDIAQILEEFFTSLPQLLLDVTKKKAEAEWALDILALMRSGHALNCSTTFRNSLMGKMTELLDPDSGVLSCGVERVQTSLFCLLANGFPLNRQNLIQILTCLRRPLQHPVIRACNLWTSVCSCITNLSLGLRRCIPLNDQVQFNRMTSEEHDLLSGYLRFMFSLQIGLLNEEWDVLSPQKDPEVQGEEDLWLSIDYSLQGDQWERHMLIAETVAQEIEDFHLSPTPSGGYYERYDFISNFEDLWRQAIGGHSILHIMSAYGLVCYIYRTSLPYIKGKPSQQFYHLASRVIACVLSSLYVHKVDSANASEEVVKQVKAKTVSCLSQDTPVLERTWDLLMKKSQGGPSSDETEAVKRAMEFLMSNEDLKDRICPS